jgi:hypothetical protein
MGTEEPTAARARAAEALLYRAWETPESTPLFPDDIEVDWDAIVPVKPLAHLAQCISKLPPFETNLDLAHCWPALPETAPLFQFTNGNPSQIGPNRSERVSFAAKQPPT